MLGNLADLSTGRILPHISCPQVFLATQESSVHGKINKLIITASLHLHGASLVTTKTEVWKTESTKHQHLISVLTLSCKGLLLSFVSTVYSDSVVPAACTYYFESFIRCTVNVDCCVLLIFITVACVLNFRSIFFICFSAQLRLSYLFSYFALQQFLGSWLFELILS